MPKKVNLTLEEHQETGRQLSAISAQLSSIFVLVANTYTTTGKNKAPAVELNKAMNAINEARNQLDNFVYHEFNQELTTDELSRIYYLRPGLERQV